MGSVAARAGPPPQALACPAAYRPRNPRATSPYQLLVTHFETLKRMWEAYGRRFERRYGFWKTYWDSAVFSSLDYSSNPVSPRRLSLEWSGALSHYRGNVGLRCELSDELFDPAFRVTTRERPSSPETVPPLPSSRMRMRDP